eukprot:m.33151 g.33151  ORF g.33151 m.33151 type:complete len:51 (-) comp7159_c0_seq1:2674-2826(-)
MLWALISRATASRALLVTQPARGCPSPEKSRKLFRKPVDQAAARTRLALP